MNYLGGTGSQRHRATFEWLRTTTIGARTGLRNIRVQDFAKKSPFQIFLMFITPSFLKGVAQETTCYGRRHKGDKFEEVSIVELINWHAIILGMTLCPLPNKKMYWQTGTVGTITYPNFGRFMSRNRYGQMLSSHIHLLPILFFVYLLVLIFFVVFVKGLCK